MCLLTGEKPCAFIEGPIHELGLRNLPAGLIIRVSCVSHCTSLLRNLKRQVVYLSPECFLSGLFEIFSLIVVKLFPDTILLVRNVLLEGLIFFKHMCFSIKQSPTNRDMLLSVVRFHVINARIFVESVGWHLGSVHPRLIGVFKFLGV